jgi:hypothetical protein
VHALDHEAEQRMREMDRQVIRNLLIGRFETLRRAYEGLPQVLNYSDEQLLASIEFGVVMSPMHARRGRLSEEEMQAAVAYVRRLAQRGR